MFKEGFIERNLKMFIQIKTDMFGQDYGLCFFG